jgi:tetratricopeptide (TPR) repeat protein
MNWIVRRPLPAFLFCIAVFTAPAQAQDIQVSAAVSTRPAITVLDSTKEQDGLLGSVRRIRTETAKIELKDGRPVEGTPQLVEVTTYGVKGNRIENTSYPIGGGLVGREEYKYDERGNITEMTVRDDRGAIINREAYSYEFDKFGNWTKMVTSLVVFENGAVKREPIEVTYRTVTYYFDDTVAKIVEEPKPVNAPVVPEPSSSEIQDQEVLVVNATFVSGNSLELAGEPPPLQKAVKSVLSVAVLPAENTDQKIANDLYLAGRNRFDAGDAPGAVDSYLQSIKLESGSAEVHLSLGHAYLKLQKDREAVKAFKQSIKLNPNLAESLYGLGFASFRVGWFREAADAFKKATAIEPQMAKAHYGLSLAYQELGMEPQLMEEYRILESLDRNLAKKLAQTFPQYNFSCRLTRGCP